MARPASEHPTDLELRILKFLWEHSPLTAREIREKLASTGRKLAHTSVITTLQKMVEKRQLSQLDPVEGKAYRFSPKLQSGDVSQGMLQDIVNRVFDGSTEAVMLSLFDAGDLDQDALKRLRCAFNKKLREQKDD